MSFVFTGDGFTLREATPADNGDLCEIFESVHVRGTLDLNQERSPDFFALLRAHHGETMTFIGHDDDGRSVGCSTAIVQDGWDGGRRIRTGYFGDLRVRPKFRGGLRLARAYGAAMAYITERTGAELFNTVIFDSNKRAVAALAGDGSEK
ncbi:MAG: hypothetical protein ACI8PZ_005107 [Myxococcota bacterium]|jgi:hypothetical protein